MADRYLSVEPPLIALFIITMLYYSIIYGIGKYVPANKYEGLLFNITIIKDF